MTDLDVRIVRLEPMRVAWIRIVSETPEHDAWEKLRPWAEALGLMENPKASMPAGTGSVSRTTGAKPSSARS